MVTGTLQCLNFMCDFPLGTGHILEHLGDPVQKLDRFFSIFLNLSLFNPLRQSTQYRNQAGQLAVIALNLDHITLSPGDRITDIV